VPGRGKCNDSSRGQRASCFLRPAT